MKTINLFKLFGAVIIIILSSCKSTTLITSEPPGAIVYIDGEEKGVTPYKYEDKKGSYSSTNIRLKNEGYKDLNVDIERDYQNDGALNAANGLIGITGLWNMKYEENYHYELTPLDPGKQLVTTDYSSDVVFTVEKAEKLKDLKDLLDNGTITQDEFEREKRKILTKK